MGCTFVYVPYWVVWCWKKVVVGGNVRKGPNIGLSVNIHPWSPWDEARLGWCFQMLFLCSILERAKGQASHCFVFAEVYEECIHAKFSVCVLFYFCGL